MLRSDIIACNSVTPFLEEQQPSPPTFYLRSVVARVWVGQSRVCVGGVGRGVVALWVVPRRRL